MSRPNPQVDQELAFAVLERIALSDPSDEACRLVSEWRAGLEARQAAGGALTVLEHTALVFALRSGYRGLRGSQGLLSRSWKRLAGHVPPDLTCRLPAKVLRRESHEVRQFHAAAFQNRPPRQAWGEVALGSDWVWLPRDGALLLGTFVLSGTSSMVREVFAGLALGYVLASLIEYGLHRSLAHAPKVVDRLMAWIGGDTEREFEELKFSHARIHHLETFRTRYNVQFDTEQQRAAVERLALNRGTRAAQDIFESGFGNSISPRGFRKGLVFGLPISLSAIAVAFGAVRALGFDVGPLFLIAAFAASLLYLPATGVFHAYMHMSREQAQAAAGPFMRWFLKTRYTALMSRLHYGHHRGRGGNYNLVFGADALFGVLKKPTVRQLLEMRKQGLIY